MTLDATAAGAAGLSLELAEPLPPEAPVGSDLVLRVRVRGAAGDVRGGDLRGGRIEIVAGEDLIAVAGLKAFDGAVSETAAFAVQAPATVTAFTWLIRFPPQEIGGAAYGECVLPVASQTRPHRTSLAVWAVPSPVRLAERFTVTVGAKSSGACALGDARIEVRDDSGAIAGEGALGQTPLPGTDALYWTEIALAGPRREGQQCWDVAFAATDVALPHLASSAQFGFTAVRPPEHRVAVTVTEDDGATAVEGVQVALGPWRAATGKTGTAHIDVPAGTYDLALWKPGFEAASGRVTIAADANVQLDLTRLPEELTAWD
jgi:PEGA domain-containing protein